MFKIKLTPTASLAFNSLHPETRKQLKNALNILKENPYSGKQLREELNYFRSLKIKRYRVIYQINDNFEYIVIIAIDHRRDIYEIATQLLK